MTRGEIEKDIVSFTHGRSKDYVPIIETHDFMKGVEYTLNYLELKGIILENIEIGDTCYCQEKKRFKIICKACQKETVGQ